MIYIVTIWYRFKLDGVYMYNPRPNEQKPLSANLGIEIASGQSKSRGELRNFFPAPYRLNSWYHNPLRFHYSSPISGWRNIQELDP